MNAIEEKVNGFSFAQSEIDDIVVECYKSTKLFAKMFFPERFHIPFSGGHDQLFDIMDSDAQMISIIAPRGMGKSTILNFVYPLKRLVYRDSNFFAPCACVSEQAMRDSEDIKNELTTNQYINAVFGSYKPRSREDDFSKKAWKTCRERGSDGSVLHTGTFVLPRGVAQKMRGIKHGRFRYDLITCDDLEGTTEVLNDEQRAKLKNWFFADLMPAVQDARVSSEGEFKWRIMVIGTLLHQDSLLINLEEDPEWESLHLEMCDDNLKSTWEAKYSDEDILRIYSRYKRQDLIDVFLREYRGIPISEESAKFKKEFFQPYTPEDISAAKGLETIVIVDPARTTEEHSADTAIVAWSLDMIQGKLFFRDCVAGKLLPDEIYKQTADMATRLGATVIGIETTGLGEFLKQPFLDFLSRWGYNFEFVDLKSKGMAKEKDNRIGSLLPYYRQGVVYHNPACSTMLEQQLLSFPFSKKKDVSDAAAYVVEMLSLGERIFAPHSTLVTGEDLDNAFKKLEASYAPAVRFRDFDGLNKIGRI